jgi:predicted aspartyl protease
LPRLDVLHGTLDHLNRPYVKLALKGFPEPVKAFVDTGFNGSLIVDQDQAERMGLLVTKRHFVTAVLASQQPEPFYLSRDQIAWLGEEPFISPLIIQETERERLARLRRKREEEIVLAVELLIGCRLEIDFAARTVAIESLA